MSQIRLRVVQGADAGQLFEVTGTIVVGRNSTSDLVLDDEQVSRRHLLLTATEGERATVEDMGSTNGTFVNGVLVTGRQVIGGGDRIQVGSTLLELVGAGGRTPTSPQTSDVRA